MESHEQAARSTAGRSAGSATPQREKGFRADIQALRAIAVVGVVAYHFWPTALTGGYVGVDVFFVISGFLIASHLMQEVESTGRVRPAVFWARRLKRLQPAALMVLLMTAVGTVVFVPPSLWMQFLHETIASSLQLQNWLLAYNAVDYLGAETIPSPVQHYWTLSAEEQFYFMFPLLLALGLIVARMGRASVRTAILALLGFAFLASLLHSIWLTRSSPSVAYLSTFTRAWEFSAGALLAFVPLSRSAAAARIVPWVGLAAIAAAFVVFDGKTAFPGYAAVLPVAGTLLCIWIGHRSVLRWVGQWAPVALVGRVSYAIYLWHWPLLILYPYAAGGPPGDVSKCALIVVTLLLAWASTRWLEDPIRFSPRILGNVMRPATVFGWSSAIVALLLVVLFVPVAVETHRMRLQRGALSAMDIDGADCLGARAMDASTPSCANRAPAGAFVPNLSVARTDDDNRTECWGSVRGEAKVCSLGLQTGFTKKLYVMGDSHSNVLIGVYSRMADKYGWRIDLSGTGGCYLTMADQEQPSEAEAASCQAWRSSVLNHARNGGYDGFIVTHSTADRLVLPSAGKSVEGATVDGIVDAWLQLPKSRIVAIRDNPIMPSRIMPCVQGKAGGTAASCAPGRAEALLFDGQAEAASRVANARVIDLTKFYCTQTGCPPVIGGVLVYRDGRHLTATYARTMQPYFEQAILQALAR